MNYLICGALLGATLSLIGFTDWSEVHAMFTFADLRMFLAFVIGAALLVVPLRLMKDETWRARPIHRGTILGGVLFGVGWALSGACPGVVLAQLGEGKLFALVSLLGVLLGNRAAAKLPYFHQGEAK